MHRNTEFHLLKRKSLVCKTVKCSWKSPYQNSIIMSLFETLNGKRASNRSGSGVWKAVPSEDNKRGWWQDEGGKPYKVLTDCPELGLSFCEGGIWKCQLDTCSILVFKHYEPKWIDF